MFSMIKRSTNLLEQIVNDTGLSFVLSGDNTYSAEGDEPSFCCGHKGCFKVKFSEDTPEENLWKCFSCDAGGTILDWSALFNKVSVLDAAHLLVKEHKLELPKDASPLQDLFNTAAIYYETCMRETSNVPQVKLARMSPLQYQTDVRRHSDAALKHFHVGFSDGGLIAFLEGLGYEDSLIEESGLRGKKGGDFLANGMFIYPHYVGNRCSHFTLKDPQKKLAYQLAGKHTLNSCEFYNQNGANKDVVVIVEGENDLISVFETGTEYGVIATIGQISIAQISWLKKNLEGKDVITAFDFDQAGDKYRSKVETLRSSFKSLTHIKPPTDKDIDDLLKDGESLETILTKYVVKVEVETKPGYTPPKIPSSVGSFSSDGAASTEGGEDTYQTNEENTGNFFERHGKYFSVKRIKDENVYTPVSNFTMKLTNIYLTEDGDRVREVILTKDNGEVSKPTLITSEVKVSLKSFRVFAAKSIDADFMGTEQHLGQMWAYVYLNAPKVLINVTRVVGRSELHKGWLLQNRFVMDTGEVIEPDETGVFYINNKTVGISPESLNKTSAIDDTSRDIPDLVFDMSKSDTDELLGGFIKNIAKNLGDPGTALLMVAWFKSVVFSNPIFKLNKGFPLLFVSGTNGQGKGTICGWLMDLYSMHHNGKTTISQLKSGVGFGRKAEYYASLPLFIDEIRDDEECKLWSNTFRSYYDRDGRTMGTMGGFGVKTQEVRSCFMFAGEDHFSDPATKERCITLRVNKMNRETVESYSWIDERKETLSAIGFQWIQEAVAMDNNALRASIKALDRALVIEAKCSSRKSKNWAVVGHFALELGAKYIPEFNMKEYLFKASTQDSLVQKSETTVSQFFEVLESVMSQEGLAKITTEHITTEGDLLHIWFPHVYRVVQEGCRGKFSFSKHAVLNAIKEEEYFVSEVKKVQMGINGVRRVVISLDLKKCPDTLVNISAGSKS
jgi:5S rRNA maturation endonuclease (ribonuclease M5)